MTSDPNFPPEQFYSVLTYFSKDTKEIKKTKKKAVLELHFLK